MGQYGCSFSCSLSALIIWKYLWDEQWYSIQLILSWPEFMRFWIRFSPMRLLIPLYFLLILSLSRSMCPFRIPKAQLMRIEPIPSRLQDENDTNYTLLSFSASGYFEAGEGWVVPKSKSAKKERLRLLHHLKMTVKWDQIESFARQQAAAII